MSKQYIWKKTNLIIAQIAVAVIIMRNKIGIVNTASYCLERTRSCHRAYVHNILLVVCLQAKWKELNIHKVLIKL